MNFGGRYLRTLTLYTSKRSITKGPNSKDFKSVIGLEVHAQISSNSKLFSGSATAFASPVNNSVSLFDCGTPGTLPVLNKRCVEAAVLTALALDCKISPVSMFDRKHYFYADLPTGYQITQQRYPLATGGAVQFQVNNVGTHHRPTYSKCSQLKQLQLEQDSGKSLHDITCSLVDLNRAGAPLMELVFEPDLCDGEEAAALVKELIAILQAIGTCSCKMEEGALRVDANVSVHLPNQPLGVRSEIKNICSVRGVAGAITYEIDRQIRLIQRGEPVINETRSWDLIRKTTVSMRDKEEKQDYRYMPEPNLPPLHIATDSMEWGSVKVADIRAQMPELPKKIRERLQTSYGLSAIHAGIIVNEPVLLKTFNEAVLHYGATPIHISNLLIYHFLGALNRHNIPYEAGPVNGAYIADIARLQAIEAISRETVALLLDRMLAGTSDSPETIVEAEGWTQNNDDTEILNICQTVLDENPKMVEQFKKGNIKVFNAIIGAIAKKTERKVNMRKVSDFVKDLLNK